MSDFSIILAILIFCVIDVALGLETPKLLVPSELKVTGGQGVGSALQEAHAGQGLWALPGLLGTRRCPGTAGWGKTPGQGLLRLVQGLSPEEGGSVEEWSLCYDLLAPGQPRHVPRTPRVLEGSPSLAGAC